MKVFFFPLSGRFEEKEREGPDCVPDAVSLSACLITALPGSSPSFCN